MVVLVSKNDEYPVTMTALFFKKHTENINAAKNARYAHTKKFGNKKLV